MSSPKEIVERIRKIRFGIGLDTSNLSLDQLDALKDKERILNDAARLSKEINTKKPHFVLELIQNAEDNDYRDGVTPRIKFVIKSNELVIQNNERGFEEKNVWALCGIGETTKKNRSLGYIGEKGIGFKSVFMITDEPHIYSNGFQFKFKYEKENPISILIPHWVEKVPNSIERRETNIVLKPTIDTKKEINEYINQIHGSLLLFLTKLRVIEVENRISRKVVKIKRHEKDGIFEIRYGKKKSYWKNVRKPLKVPDSNKEERRKDIHETEMVLAFPLRNDGSADTSQKQNIFAFLPIRKYGFKFIIQADFLLPIGREDIIKDNEWNKWLRDSVVSVFLGAVEHFKADEKLKYTFYNYIPIKKEVDDDFFTPAVEQLCKELHGIECLLTESNQWKKPSDVLKGDDEVRRLVSNDDLQRFIGKEYLSARIKVAKEILQELNIYELSTARMLECLKHRDWVEKQSSEWFVFLYKYLSKQELTDEQMALLRKLRIIKLENGRLTSVDAGPVFLPLSKRGKDYGFESELSVVRKDILELVEKLEKKDKTLKIVDFLKKVGIRPPQAYEIIENHIIPAYEDRIWKEKDESILLGYVRYIKDNLKEYEEESDRRLNSGKASWERKEDPLKRLKKSLFVRISNNGERKYEHVENIYLSKIYGNVNDLETLFHGINVNFLHPCYIEEILKEYEKKIVSDKTRSEKIRKWRTFFLKLGASDLLIVKKDPGTEIDEGPNYADNKVTRKWVSKWKKEETIWKGCEWKDTNHRGYYIGDDWRSKDFDKFVQKLEKFPGDIKASLCKKLTSLLDKNWNKYKKYKSCRYYYRSYGQMGWSPAETPSTFLLSLQNAAWCPTSQNTLAKPSQIFLDKSDIKEVLGDSVFRLALEIKNEDFIKDLGFNTEANVEGVLNFLRASVEQGLYEKIHFEKIYDFLNKHFEDEEDGIRDAFSNYPLIYVPNTEKKFFTSKEILWKDVSDIFGMNRAYLEKHYPKLKYFFVEKLRISEKPSPKDYADVLVDISEKDEITDKDKHLVLKIYEELNYYLDSSNVEKPLSEEDWWNEFAHNHICLTERNEFWRNERDVFINDRKELYDLFKEEQDIAFLLLPKGYHPDRIKLFIKATGIRYLSSVIEITPVFDKSSCSEHKELSRQMRNLIPYIIRYLYWKENSKYEELKGNGFFNTFTGLKVYVVEKLQVKYTININKWKSISTSAERTCILYQNKLYIAKGCEDKTDYAAMEFSRIFGQIKGLDSFIVSIYERQSREKVEDLLTVMGIEALPELESIAFAKPSPKIPEIEEAPMIPEKEAAEPPPLPSEHERGPTELHLSDLTTEKVSEDWVPECQPKQAEAGDSEEYVPEEITRPPETREDMRTRHISPESEQPAPPSETREKGLSEKSKIAIGRWGEEYALGCLKKDKMKEYPDTSVTHTENGFALEKDGKTLVKVVWLNKDGDQGRGHDIELWENDVLYYIEVKSTKSEEKDWFDLSRDQWALMQEKGDKFFIYRIYGAGKRKPPPPLKIRNPARLWREGSINAYPVRIQL